MGDIVSIELFNSISSIINEARNRIKTTVNSAMVLSYWNIGRLIVEDEQQGKSRADYGKVVLKDLSDRLTERFGRGFTERNLRNFRQFYLYFPIRHAVRAELSWTHYRSILKVEKEDARLWYQDEAIKENWSTRALERQINSFYYDRLLASQNRLPVIEEAKNKTKDLTPGDILKDPYVLEFLNLKNRAEYTEAELESALIDLKRGKLTHQDIGQMDTYIRIYEEKVKEFDDNPTIGIILCADKNETIAKYSMLADNEQLFASKYKLYLPTEEELQLELSKEIALLEGGIVV